MGENENKRHLSDWWLFFTSYFSARAGGTNYSGDPLPTESKLQREVSLGKRDRLGTAPTSLWVDVEPSGWAPPKRSTCKPQFASHLHHLLALTFDNSLPSLNLSFLLCILELMML